LASGKEERLKKKYALVNDSDEKPIFDEGPIFDEEPGTFSAAKDSLELTDADNTHFNSVRCGHRFETLSNPSAPGVLATSRVPAPHDRLLQPLAHRCPLERVCCVARPAQVSFLPTTAVWKETSRASFMREKGEHPKGPHDRSSDKVLVVSLEGIDDTRRAEIHMCVTTACTGWAISQVEDTAIVPDMVRLARDSFTLPPEDKLPLGPYIETAPSPASLILQLVVTEEEDEVFHTSAAKCSTECFSQEIVLLKPSSDAPTSTLVPATPRAIVEVADNSFTRYIPIDSLDSSGAVLSRYAIEGHEAPEVLVEMTTQCLVIPRLFSATEVDIGPWPPPLENKYTWLSDTMTPYFSFDLSFCYGQEALKQRPPWPPPTQWVMHIVGAQLRPIPWPSYGSRSVGQSLWWDPGGDQCLLTEFHYINGVGALLRQQANLSFVKKKGWLVLLQFLSGGQHNLSKEAMVFMQRNYGGLHKSIIGFNSQIQKNHNGCGSSVKAILSIQQDSVQFCISSTVNNSCCVSWLINWKTCLQRAITHQPCYDGPINGGKVAAHILQDIAIEKYCILSRQPPWPPLVQFVIHGGIEQGYIWRVEGLLFQAAINEDDCNGIIQFIQLHYDLFDKILWSASYTSGMYYNCRVCAWFKVMWQANMSATSRDPKASNTTSGNDGDQANLSQRRSSQERDRVS
jgi:hypothetical protein